VDSGAKVQLLSAPYRIVVDVATTRLMLYFHNRELLSAPAGVGTTTDPTPLGNYFVAFYEAPPTPGYGARSTSSTKRRPIGSIARRRETRDRSG